MQQSLRRFLTTSMLATGLITLTIAASPAAAHTCPAACGNASRSCSGTMARQFYLGCRFECAATFPADVTARKACVSDCRDVLATDKADCAAERADCSAECATVADEFCAGEVCGRNYNACLKDVRAATRACIDAAGDNGPAVQACVEPGDVMQNTGRAALEDCRSNVATGLDACLAGC